MLVLTRRVGEEIVLPDHQVTVTVLKVKGSQVQLGVAAPQTVVVQRKEVWRRALETSVGPVGKTMTSARILIADPDTFLLSEHGDYLRQCGATVATAADGLECLQRLRDFQPDVLVLEPAIPWGGGDGILAVLQDQPQFRPGFLLLLTHSQDRGLLYRLSPFKIDDYQIKPLTPQRLAERIGSLLRQRENNRLADNPRGDD